MRRLTGEEWFPVGLVGKLGREPPRMTVAISMPSIHKLYGLSDLARQLHQVCKGAQSQAGVLAPPRY